MAMNTGKYNVTLVSEHGLNPPKFQLQKRWNYYMCISCKDAFTHLSYDANDDDNAA